MPPATVYIKQILTPFVLPESSVIQSTLKSWKPTTMQSPVRVCIVSVKHKTEDEEKSVSLHQQLEFVQFVAQ